MTEPVIRKLLGVTGRDAGCDTGFELLDEYAETVNRGDPISERYAELVTHIGNCTACREDTESLLAVLREQEKPSEG